MYSYKKKTVAGATILIEKYNSRRRAREGGRKIPRCENINSTDMAQANRNYLNSLKYHEMLISSNFGKDDLFLTFTYEVEPASIKDANKIIRNFFKRLKYHRNKKRLPKIKWVMVTEDERSVTKRGGGKGRIHHHVMMSKYSMDEICDLWTEGNVQLERLQANKSYWELNTYISKELSDKKKFSSSRNLTKPAEQRGTLKSRKEITRREVCPKGYKIDFESWQGNENGDYYCVKFVKIGGMTAKEIDKRMKYIQTVIRNEYYSILSKVRK